MKLRSIIGYILLTLISLCMGIIALFFAVPWVTDLGAKVVLGIGGCGMFIISGACLDALSNYIFRS